jgi:UDP-N-acetylglucosamine:LPS N-acetylglucosamine transferase
VSARRQRVLAISSSGGHWIELRRLAPAFEGFDTVWCSTMPGFAEEVGSDRFILIPDGNRWNKIRLAWVALRVLLVLLRVRPDIVISTGAAPGFFAIRFARLLGRASVWVDSIANAGELSLSGQRSLRFASLTLTQWPELGEPLPEDLSRRSPRTAYFAGAVV